MTNENNLYFANGNYCTKAFVDENINFIKGF